VILSVFQFGEPVTMNEAAQSTVATADIFFIIGSDVHKRFGFITGYNSTMFT